MSLKGAGYIVGAWEHPTRKASDKSVTLLHAECAKGALDDAGLTKDDVDGYYCAGDAPGLGPMSMVDYMGLKVPPRGLHRCRRLLLPGRGRPCAGGDRHRTLQRRADHARRPAAQRGHGDRHRAARRQSRAAGNAVRISVWPGDREHVRDVRHAAHARIRHDQRTARLDQGRRVASRAAQSARDAARRRYGRGRGEFADGGEPAASPGLLRHQRRRRRADRHQAGDRQKPEAAAGESHRRRRGAEEPGGRRRSI